MTINDQLGNKLRSITPLVRGHAHTCCTTWTFVDCAPEASLGAVGSTNDVCCGEPNWADRDHLGLQQEQMYESTLPARRNVSQIGVVTGRRRCSVGRRGKVATGRASTESGAERVAR